MLVTCDLGKTLIKLAYNSKIEVFPATLYTYEIMNLENKPRRYDFTIRYKGENYIGGTLAKDEGIGAGFFNSDVSKAHTETLINLLLALSLTGEKVFDLIISTPISKHTEEEKKRLKDMIIGTHSIRINSEDYACLIRNLEVAPGGASAIFSYGREGLIRGLDFGSTTVNYFSVDNKRFINKDSGTFNFGGKSYENMNIALKTKEVLANLKNKWGKEDSVMVLGGWGKEAYPVIKEEYPNAFMVSNPITATVEGLYQLGRMKYETICS